MKLRNDESDFRKNTSHSISIYGILVLRFRGGVAMQDQDFRWFIDNYNELFKEYGVSFLAIKNKRVLGSYNSYSEAVDKTAEQEPLGTFIVQKCNGEESAYTNHIATIYLS